jgi:hypothetical protein
VGRMWCGRPPLTASVRVCSVHCNNSEFASLCIYKNRKNGGVLVMLCVSYLRVCVSVHGREHDEVSVGPSGTVEF